MSFSVVVFPLGSLQYLLYKYITTFYITLTTYIYINIHTDTHTDTCTRYVQYWRHTTIRPSHLSALAQRVDEPVETFIEPVALDGGRFEDGPWSALERREPQLLCDRIRRHRVQKVLLVVSYQSFRASAQPALSRQRTHAAHTHLSIAMPPVDPAASAEATHGSPNRTKGRSHNAPARA